MVAVTGQENHAGKEANARVSVPTSTPETVIALSKKVAVKLVQVILKYATGEYKSFTLV